MNVTSEKKLTKVHPGLAQTVRELADSLDFEITVVQGLRTFGEQDALFAQGRTRPGKIVTKARGGQSAHNFGLAVDLAPIDRKGRIDWNTDSKFHLIGRAGKDANLEWGGDWRNFPDMPHIQMPGWTITAHKNEPLALYRSGGMDAVWQEAARRLAARTPSASTANLPESAETDSQDNQPPATEGVSAAAAEVKMAAVSPTAKTISFSAIGTAILAALKEAWQSSQEQVIQGAQLIYAHLAMVLIIIGLAALGIWLYNKERERAQERTQKIVDIHADPKKQNVVIT